MGRPGTGQKLLPPLRLWVAVQVLSVQPIYPARVAPYVVASLHSWLLAERARRHRPRLVQIRLSLLLGCHMSSLVPHTATNSADTSPDPADGASPLPPRYSSRSLDYGKSFRLLARLVSALPHVCTGHPSSQITHPREGSPSMPSPDRGVSTKSEEFVAQLPVAIRIESPEHHRSGFPEKRLFFHVWIAPPSPP